MNNFRRSLKELFQVNNQAGILRLFLTAAFTFVLWSLFAVISASFDPLGSLNLTNILGINSENLALSLFLDIIKAYFSIFSVALTLLFLLIALLSLEITALFLSRMNSFSSKRLSKNFLTSCAFSFPKQKKLVFPDDQRNSSGNNLNGPFEAVIKPGNALLVRDWADYSVIFNNINNHNDLEVFLSFKEKVIDCFTLEPSSLSFEFEDLAFSKTYLIELAYSFILPTGTENTVRFANMLALFDSGNIRKIIESHLMSESKIAISQYLRNSVEPSDYLFSRVQEAPIENKNNTYEQLEQKKYSKVLNFYKQSKGLGIKRNRKRPIYLTPMRETAAMEKIHEENLSPTLMDQLNELLEKDLQSTILTLFGTNCIKAIILNIQE